MASEENASAFGIGILEMFQSLLFWRWHQRINPSTIEYVLNVRFNPYYSGGGIRGIVLLMTVLMIISFNPYYSGGGIRGSASLNETKAFKDRFNPYYSGGGIRGRGTGYFADYECDS